MVWICSLKLSYGYAPFIHLNYNTVNLVNEINEFEKLNFLNLDMFVIVLKKTFIFYLS